MKIYHADCLEQLKKLPDNSVDSIVTDPPYGINFMGKKWDYDVPKTEIWKECLRVLKPGGHLLAFAGTRTQHRMAVNIEDAGFEIRDMLAWVYGCLDDTSEILTSTGWKNGLDVVDGDMVAAWDPETGNIKLSPVLETIKAPYKGDMIVFKNDDTDQLLTPNHRVYSKSRQRKMVDGKRVSSFEGNWKVSQAGEINRWNAINFPLSGNSSGEGIGGREYAALLGWVWAEGGFDKTGTGVRIYQSESANPEKVKELQVLIDNLVPNASRYDREKVYTYKGNSRKYSETCWFFTGDIANRIREDLPNKRPTWDLLWRMTSQEKEAFIDSAMKGDGSGTAFYQKDENDLHWFQALMHLSNKKGRINFKKSCVATHNRNTTQFQARHLKEDRKFYDGLVWCVRVETGAFVARRNGKVFITGNSGFPKSMDVSKAIDKQLGSEREVVGVKKFGARDGSVTAGCSRSGTSGGYNFGTDYIETSPSSDESKKWNGWGTCLKPALEPITLARKPVSEQTIAENVLTHGTGGINIDGCRVGTEVLKEVKRENRQTNIETFKQESSYTPERSGRFPSNFIHDGSDEIQDVFGESSRFFYCAKASKKDRNEGLEGFADVQPNFARGTGLNKKGDGEATAKNHHPTVKPTDLMRYLCRLITPPGGTVLDPFMGSGSTGKAAVLEGFDFIGIELDKDYVEIAKKRIEHAKKSIPTQLNFDI